MSIDGIVEENKLTSLTLFYILIFEFCPEGSVGLTGEQLQEKQHVSNRHVKIVRTLFRH